MTQPSQRFWEIDVLRGIAILMMITYHTLYDLDFFHVYQIPLYSLPILLFRFPIGTTFLLLVGMSLTLSYSKAQAMLTKLQMHQKFLLRGLFIFGCGMLITLATWLYLKEGFIVFGVLHCIGLSILFAYPLLRFRVLNGILGSICIVVGFYLLFNVTVGFPWLLWLGFVPAGFYTLDYFPLLPWFGVVLIGVFLGNTLYKNNTRTFTIKDLSGYSLVRGMSFLGKHALLIYLLHQLVIIGLLYVFFLH